MIMVHTAETKHRPTQAHCFAFSIVLSLLPRRIGIQPCPTGLIPTTLKEKHGRTHSFFTNPQPDYTTAVGKKQYFSWQI